MLKKRKLIAPSGLLCAATNTLAFWRLAYFKRKWLQDVGKTKEKLLTDIDFVVTLI
jgi:hypothetical protein